MMARWLLWQVPFRIFFSNNFIIQNQHQGSGMGKVGGIMQYIVVMCHFDGMLV